MTKINKILSHLYSIVCLLYFIFKKNKHYKKDDNKIIYLTFLGIKYDGRVRKSVDSLLAKGFNVELIKPSDAQDDDLSSWHPNLSITLLGLSGSFSHFPYIFDWKIFDYLMHSNASRIYCRDLFTGIMGSLVGKKTGKTSIVDFYEWYSEAKEYDYVNRQTKQKPLWKKKLFKFYERYICKNTDQLITNNLSFANGIAQGVVSIEKFNIIRNIPDSSVIKTDARYNLRNFISTEHSSKKVLYYVGQLSFDRKLETLIQGMKDLPECVLIIQGSGYIETQKLFSNEINLSKAANRIFFLPPIPDYDIISYASTADVGIFICDSKDNKMYHALPNKLFEYVYAGIPQITCNGLEIKKIIEKKKIGLIFDAYNSESFVQQINNIFENNTYSVIKNNVLNFKNECILSNEFIKI